MYLKRIEAIGFKSFADRTELEFVPGVTAVVGPNGSGKSNISDAIRWVLGEQSAKSLRGAKMEDVIFAGSDTRKPVNFCEVSLTLDNSNRELDLEYNEVTVTRRVYRSGDSEYMINKQSCRLKDITEMFMDTGLGKEAYSIIGQGRIDEILSNKSEDRRGIFEEAAGIVKYKSRKKEAEKKLDETTANLIRIADVIGELDASMEPMSYQAEVAQEARTLRKELERYEVALYVHDIQDLKRRFDESAGECAKLEADHLDRSAQVSAQEADYEKLRWELAQLEQSIEGAQKSLVEVVQEYEKSEGRRKLLQERQQNLQTSRADLDAVLEKLLREREQTDSARSQEQDKADSLRAHIETLKRDLEEKLNLAKGYLDRAQREEEVEHLKSDLIEKLNDSASKRNELKNLESSLEVLLRRIARLADEEREFTERLTQLSTAHDEANQLRGEEGAQEEEVLKILQSLRAKVESQAQDQEKRSGILRQWQTDRASHRSRLELLRDMESQYGGYQVGVRSILQAAQRGQVQGVRGAVAELMHVPREYELSIETALGGAMQNVVVEDERAGRGAIHFLKTSGGGRATFMPMDVIKGRPLGKPERMAIQSHNGFIGVASELVSCDPEYRNIIDNLLGSVVVARAIADANALARLLQYRVRVVTLDGDVVNPGGSMTGGSVQKKGTSLLGRTREIEEMEEKLKALDRKMTDAQAVYDQQEQQLLQAKDEIARLVERSEQQRGSLYSYDATLRELAAQRGGVEERLELVRLEMGQYRVEEQDNRTKQEHVRGALVLLEAETIGLQKAVDELQTVLKEQQTVAADVNEEVTAFKVKLAGVEQERASVMENVERLLARVEEISLEFAQREQERQAIEQRLEETLLELQAAQSLFENFEEHRNAAQDKLDQHRQRKVGLVSRMSEMEAQLREARLQLKNLEQLVHHNEVKVNRLDVELQNALTKLAEEYHISFDLARERYPLPEDIAITKRKVQEFRREMERLGDVNYGAIEEYARMQERHAYLTEQRDDLVKAVEQLYEVIREIEEEMSKRFHETFSAIREQFSGVFVALFGGGRADLMLTDPDKPLTTGIDVVAQPPGKKLQNLQLLSGGERALAALSLLFAILRIKPVPFCVLDEVEAALDEANVARYSKYLRDFSKETQFIVVTHRKGTMEGADVLYGVTMQESGVSKVVSVRLIDQAMEMIN